ncbi:MAG: GyrI-like domain-containing protein [Spirochaetes bacterium]|jgi:hypothetical protein|nr:GyrI-like domain-containing protein [Spirochaetota bacterium]
MKKIIIASAAALIAAAAAYAVYSGLFTGVVITEKSIGPLKLVYEEHVGDYRESGRIQNTVYRELASAGIMTKKGFGIYYDDPKTVPAEKLRSRVGCVLESEDYGKIPVPGKKFKIMDLPEKKCVYAEFPHRTWLSILFGISRVYPAMSEYVRAKGYRFSEVIEIYDVPMKKIEYAMAAVKR